MKICNHETYQVGGVTNMRVMPQSAARKTLNGKTERSSPETAAEGNGPCEVKVLTNAFYFCRWRNRQLSFLRRVNKDVALI